MPDDPSLGYGQQTAWSDPGRHHAYHATLPADPAALPDCLEGFVIHHAAARSLGFGVPEEAEDDRNLRKVSRLLEVAVQRDDRPLTELRQLSDYLYGTCHDFALITASVLRAKGVAVRLRVGFADYFIPDRWEDHWVCEYRTAAGWALLDGQLGWRAREALKIDFPAHDVPRSRFRTSPEVWREVRAGQIDPAHCGVSFAGIEGLWWVASNVLRDAAALAGIETLPWDSWGPARAFSETKQVDAAWPERLDELASALTPPPETRLEAEEVLDRFPWARPTATVSSLRNRQVVEVALE